MILIFIKQHLSSIWSSIQGKVKQQLKKKNVYSENLTTNK